MRPENAAQKQRTRGKPFRKASGNPAGKAPGTPTLVTQIARHRYKQHALGLMFALLLQRTASALVHEVEHQCDSSHQNKADSPRHI
jgi:hypothetical protein